MAAAAAAADEAICNAAEACDCFIFLFLCTSASQCDLVSDSGMMHITTDRWVSQKSNCSHLHRCRRIDPLAAVPLRRAARQRDGPTRWTDTLQTISTDASEIQQLIRPRKTPRQQQLACHSNVICRLPPPRISTAVLSPTVEMRCI